MHQVLLYYRIIGIIFQTSSSKHYTDLPHNQLSMLILSLMLQGQFHKGTAGTEHLAISQTMKICQSCYHYVQKRESTHLTDLTACCLTTNQIALSAVHCNSYSNFILPELLWHSVVLFQLLCVFQNTRKTVKLYILSSTRNTSVQLCH